MEEASNGQKNILQWFHFLFRWQMILQRSSPLLSVVVEGSFPDFAYAVCMHLNMYRMLRVFLLSTLLIASKTVCALNLREDSVPKQQESLATEEQVLERKLESGFFKLDISLNMNVTNTPCSAGDMHDLRSLLWQQIDHWVPIALSVDDEQAVVEYGTLSVGADGTRGLVGEDEQKLSTEEQHARDLFWWDTSYLSAMLDLWFNTGGVCYSCCDYCDPDDDDGWRRLDGDIEARLQALIEPVIQTYVETMACYQGNFSIDIDNFSLG